MPLRKLGFVAVLSVSLLQSGMLVQHANAATWFHVSGGKIIAPNGQTFVGKGVNINDWAMTDAVRNSNATPLLTLFPGLTMVRLNMNSYAATSTLVSWVNWLTAKGIVVEIEDHTGIGAAAYTGSQ